MARVTIADVAVVAGVDKATVSRALRGDGRISRVTAERVRQVALSLGYQADAAARALTGQQSGLVALCLADWSQRWTGPFLARLLYVLRRRRLEVLVLDCSADAGRRLASRRVQAFLWHGTLPERFECKAPAICLGSSGRSVDTVCILEPGLPKSDEKAGQMGVALGKLLVAAALGEEMPKSVTLLLD